MKRVFYLLILGFALINLNFLCPIYYLDLEGYSDIPSGPITLQELQNFNPENVKDLKGNGMPLIKYESLRFYKKLQFDSSYSYVDYIPAQDKAKAQRFLDSMSKEMQLGDSILMYIQYTEDVRSIDYEGYYYFGDRYESRQVYVVKTETIASLMRKGNSFISTYPNPTADKFVLQCDAPESIEASFFVLDQMGRKIIESDIEDIRQSTEISLEAYSPGAYVVYLIIDGEFFTKKIVKS